MGQAIHLSQFPKHDRVVDEESGGSKHTFCCHSNHKHHQNHKEPPQNVPLCVQGERVRERVSTVELRMPLWTNRVSEGIE